MIGAVLWDLDGTLVDSEEYHWRAWCQAMASEGVSITREQFLATFGQRNDTIIPQWLGVQATSEQVARVGDAKEASYRQAVREQGISPLPGAAEWVRQLQKEGWRQAVASSAPRLNVEVVLEALGLASHFQALATAEDVKRGKPDPEVFLVAAARVGTPPSRCVVVEDAAAGVEAARRAGMKSVGLRLGSAAGSASLDVDSLADLPENAFHNLLDATLA